MEIHDWISVKKRKPPARLAVIVTVKMAGMKVVSADYMTDAGTWQRWDLDGEVTEWTYFPPACGAEEEAINDMISKGK